MLQQIYNFWGIEPHHITADVFTGYEEHYSYLDTFTTEVYQKDPVDTIQQVIKKPRCFIGVLMFLELNYFTMI